ncbi:MAG: AMP-binding protein [Elusimicrobia bacterium]|nr:AMP-binding protein [Elusimicrobiota bacterium]
MANTLRCPGTLGPLTPTVGAMLSERRGMFRGLPAYRERRGGVYQTLMWPDFYEAVARVGTALAGWGAAKGDVVATYTRNREEMLLIELAAMSIGAVAAPVFAGYPAPQLDYILEHSGARMLLASDGPHLDAVLSTKASRRLKRIFVADPCASRDGRVASFETLMSAGARARRQGKGAFERRLKAVGPNDACLLMYTSGTTGRPKGVLLSHRNILAQRKAMHLLWKLKPGGRFLSYLPWHHSFGGIFELFCALYTGACLTLDESYGRDVPLLIENFKRVRPTVYFSVPSIYQALVDEARRSAKAERAIFHPELQFVFTAAAPLPRHLSDYFEAKRIPVVEGWGLTETSPCLTATRVRVKRRQGAVGWPIPGVELKLAEDGEILVRGPHVMLGYHKDPALTARVITAAGWLHTGDFGEFSGHGLVLKCRRDGMFKLTTGQMVISNTVENALVASPLIRHAVAVGRDFVGALIFPDFQALERHAGVKRGASASNGRLLKDARVRRLLRKALDAAAQSVPEKYARPRAFVLAPRELSLAQGELTPTMKVVRSRVVANFSAHVDAMFRRRASGGLERGIIRLQPNHHDQRP